MAKRKKFTVESNLTVMQSKIEEAPHKVLSVIGQNLVREIRPDIPRRRGKNGGKLRSSLGYWARKQEKDLQIGVKQFYALWIIRRDTDPIKPVVMKNISTIQSMIGYALDQIRKGK
ncbi:hypothetical protein AOC36_09545 [Erysipelothrix larvae]|uniref:HK97 gp10 family phage protein n=1 Tax=Erysipelothrix larvae TaxID=1514105 RepID=A0A109UHG2_9FIRM|nr:hypothetical protein [Erysipelothrix larvae]AMC94217.1 hypothetical protein AOC36_09545 [Erysipelothrix larvae]